MRYLILFLSVILFGYDSPYSLKKFRNTLDISKLQAPSSSYNPLYSVKYGNFAYYSNKYFYLQDRRYMTFFMCGKKNRSELRFKQDWKVDTKNAITLKTSVKLFPLNEKREFTFLQIHADSTLKNSINKPLLRIVWKKELHGKKNHLWAVVRMDNTIKGKYAKFDLGVMPQDFFMIKIRILHSKISLWIDEKEVLNGLDVSYWDRYYNYFKAGVYLQDEGCAKALFDEIKIDYKGEK